MASQWTEEARRRFAAWRDASLTWDPVAGGKAPIIAWSDNVVGDAGPASSFEVIAGRMLSGNYYPPDAIECFGPWIDENREIRVGDRMLQRARLLPFSRWPGLWSMTEVFVAERTPTTCSLGYVTTKKHFGRGIWQATLSVVGDELELRVKGISGPASWLFWLGLPVGRFLQKRAWRRAFEGFSKLCERPLRGLWLVACGL